MFSSLMEALFMLGESHNVTTSTATATSNAIKGQGKRDWGGLVAFGGYGLCSMRAPVWGGTYEEMAGRARVLPRYSPARVIPSMRNVGQAVELRNSRSLPISEMLFSMSLRFPATVTSSTGNVSSPSSIQ